MMQPKLDQRKNAFVELGKLLNDYINGKLKNRETLEFLDKNIDLAGKQNPWFDRGNIFNSLTGISQMLEEEKFNKWLDNYNSKLQSGLKIKCNIAVIMAGNIPLVNFHDFLCVLITGHNFIGKLSSNDQVLPIAISDLLISIEPSFENKIHFTSERLSGFDAVVATGSDNSSRYFEYYFGKYPHIIRKNRNSIAVLDGSEDKQSLEALAGDIFSYYGLGCRNVSTILVPENYSFDLFFEALKNWKSIIEFYKYKNNYDFYKSVFLVNKTPHLDNGFVLLKEDNNLSSPLSVIHYQQYSSKENIKEYIKTNKDLIQCIVASEFDLGIEGITTSFGKSQFPELWDYPDRIDTVHFLLNINQ